MILLLTKLAEIFSGYAKSEFIYIQMYAVRSEDMKKLSAIVVVDWLNKIYI